MGTKISAENLCSLTPTTELNLRPRVRSEVICYVLAGISKEASRFVRLKYANDFGNLRAVAHALVRSVRKRAPKVLSEDELWALAIVAIRETVSDHMCGTCNGKSWVSTGMKQIMCFTCKGTGKRSKKSKDIADDLEVSLGYYNRYCKRLVERNMMGILASYEGELHNAFRSRL